MCGRFTLTEDWSFIEAYFEIVMSEVDGFYPRYNIAPTQPVPVIVLEAARRVARWMQWGIRPGGTAPSGPGGRGQAGSRKAPVLFNARAETLLERPAFRRLVPQRRCLIPADGFYEWQAGPSGAKQPYRIRLKTRPLFAFAGLYDVQRTPDGGALWTCTIITCAPNELMARLHDRMPVILPREAESTWLDPSLPAAAAVSLLQPLPADEMTYYPVSPAVGNARRDDPSLVEPVR
jgi:putative SOS response-associated peptidase YedK